MYSQRISQTAAVGKALRIDQQPNCNCGDCAAPVRRLTVAWPNRKERSPHSYGCNTFALYFSFHNALASAQITSLASIRQSGTRAKTRWTDLLNLNFLIRHWHRCANRRRGRAGGSLRWGRSCVGNRTKEMPSRGWNRGQLKPCACDFVPDSFSASPFSRSRRS